MLYVLWWVEICSWEGQVSTVGGGCPAPYDVAKKKKTIMTQKESSSTLDILEILRATISLFCSSNVIAKFVEYL